MPASDPERRCQRPQDAQGPQDSLHRRRGCSRLHFQAPPGHQSPGHGGRGVETCLSAGRLPRSVSQTVKPIHESGHRSDRRNALGSKGRTALSHTGLPERRGESSLPSLPGTLWGVRPASVPEPLPGGAWAHLDTPARGSVSPHGASRALKGRLPWWRWGGTRPGSR